MASPAEWSCWPPADLPARLREAVRDLADGGSTLNDDAKRQLEARMAQALPGAPLGWLVPLGADAVAAELATEAS